MQLDVGPDHRPATQLDGQSIRALLKDRAPLLRPRQALAERSLAAHRFQSDAADLVSVIFSLTFTLRCLLFLQSVIGNKTHYDESELADVKASMLAWCREYQSKASSAIMEDSQLSAVVLSSSTYI